jgi:hypothetical protein
MAIIDQTINALRNNKIEQMKEKLVKLGERHYIYGVKKEYLAVKYFLSYEIKQYFYSIFAYSRL